MAEEKKKKHYPAALKVPVTVAELELVNKLTTDKRAYGHPFAPGKVIVGDLRFPRGEQPEHLKKYAGQTADIAKECAGREGLSFVLCMRRLAAEKGITKNERKLRRAGVRLEKKEKE
jgi:hypothetical protein